ncbi:MAG: hypothetical protein ACOH15_08765 [Acetobacterium sp.]
MPTDVNTLEIVGGNHGNSGKYRDNKVADLQRFLHLNSRPLRQKKSKKYGKEENDEARK